MFFTVLQPLSGHDQDGLKNGWRAEANKTVAGSHHFKAMRLNVCLKKTVLAVVFA